MRSALLSAALEEACRERVMIGKYPSCVLHLTMPYEAVDVNVHPNKLEVRFRDEQAVSEAVTTVVREALRDRDAFERPVPMPIAPETPSPTAAVTRDREPVPVAVVRGGPSAPAPVSFEEAVPRAAIPTTLRQTPAPIRPAAPAQVPQPLPPPALPQEPVSFLQPERKPLRILGVLFKTYILVEYADHLLMIDQHAVHERLLFDRMMRESGTVQAGQELLIPQIVSVTQREQQVLQENRELLEGIGFALEPFGEQEISVRRIPMILGEPQTAAFLHEVLDQLSGEPRGFTLEKRRTLILQSACKHAVKGGETLSEEDIRSLVEQMLEQHVTPTCPHGRPLVVAISHTELDKRFKRIQH